MEDFSEFYAAHRDRVFRVVLAAGRQRAVAEDAVAEAFARAFAGWSHVGAHPNPPAWVMLTALRLQRSWWRRVRREVTGPISQRRASDEPAGTLPEDLRQAVRQLPRRQREVIALRVLGDLSAAETGEVLGIAVGTVGVHLSRALATLRRSMTGDSEQADLKGADA